MKKLFLVIFAMILLIPAKAQLSIGKSAGQIITENAVSGSVIVIKQSYQVKNKKTGNIYGRDGRKDFGHFYSIGIKAEPGLILTDAAIRPWLFDDAFKKVEQDYEPIVSLTELREVKADGKVNFYQQPLQMERQQPNGLWIANVSEAAKRSIEIDKESGVKEGWLVWFVASKNLDSNPEAEITVQTFNKRLEIPEDGDDLELDANLNSDLVLGGIYVCPTFLGGGYVAYRLAGIAIQNDKKWKLRTSLINFDFMSSSSSRNSQDESNAEGDDQDVQLTPIEKEKKDKRKRK